MRDNVLDKYHQGIDDKFPKRIHPATCTSDGLLTAEDKCKLDAIDLDDWEDRVYDIATPENDGLMSKEDKAKLDGIEENANNYIHPDNENIRHVTDKEKEYWNAKASTDIVTQDKNGLMSAEDKIKLDNIEDYANNYIHPDTPEIRHVTDKEKEYWNNKASTDNATQENGGLMSAADKKKLDSIEEGANKYVHPNNKSTRHVTDANIEYWSNKADKDRATPTEDGLMSYIDKKKLDSLSNYIHPDTPEIRHVTDKEKEYWNNKADRSVATQEKSGLMSWEDKKKLDNLSEINIDDIPTASEEAKGLMSPEDKIKLNKIVTPTERSITLRVNGWSDTFPYTQSIAIENMETSSTVGGYIGLALSATEEEYQCAVSAKLSIQSIKNGIVTIQAEGEKPNMSLPIIVMIGSSVIVVENKYNMELEYMSEPPTQGEYTAGDIVYSNIPHITNCLGWVCTESGTPGKWKQIGIASA